VALSFRLGLLLQVAAFAAAAVPAERLEVIEFVGASLADRDDVVDFERLGR
jgi:hypothetical protein